MPSIRIKRGTRAQLNAAGVAAQLKAGEVYLLSDESRLAVGTATTTYQAVAKQGEGGGAAVVAGTKALGYTNGLLTSVNGPGAATKTLTRTNGILTQVQAVSGGVTVTKTLGYTGAAMTTVNTVVS